MNDSLDELFSRYPGLGPCKNTVMSARDALLASFRAGGKVLVCGNGGSTATLGVCIACLFFLGLFASRRGEWFVRLGVVGGCPSTGKVVKSCA